MTIQECIDKTDSLNPNQYSLEDKLSWLSALDKQIDTDIIKSHVRYPHEEPIVFEPYDTEHMTKDLLVPFPFDEVYVSFLNMKIAEKNQETTRYNNNLTLYKAYYEDFERWYNKFHRPINRAKYRIW